VKVRPGTLRTAIAVAAAAVLLGGPAAVVTGRFAAVAAVGGGSTVSAGRAAGIPAAGAAAPAGQDTDPAAARAADAIAAATHVQVEAVNRGDATAFLGPVEAPLQGAMRQRFEAMRAIHATNYAAHLDATPKAEAGGWRVTIELSFCTGAPGCGEAPVRVPTLWTVNGDGARLVEWGKSTHYGPRPWEVSELRAAIGNRVVVAASPRYASRLQSTLQTAERAAEKADRYARWRPAPSRYVVYLAGTDEWSTWYGVKQPSWAAGYAMPITPEHTEIVLNAARIDANEALNTLTHEFSHVTTLAGVRRNYTDSWLLVEGMAEYVAHHEKPAGAYPWLSGTRNYVGGGKWPGTAALAAPAESASVGDATGRYGVAYFAVRRLAERFGEDKLLAFFAAVARDGRQPDQAAPDTFGVSWTDAAADCDRYVRSVAS
jgi:hypothetical protein